MAILPVGISAAAFPRCLLMSFLLHRRSTLETTHYIMYISNLALLGLFASQVAAVPVPADHVLHERRGHVPSAWVKRDRLDPSATLPVRIGMSQQNLDKGYDLLLEV